MENARIAMFEDSADFVIIVGGMLRRAGHTIIGVAGSMPDAEQLIKTTPADGLDVALVDGNLSPGDSSGRDGRRIAELIHGRFASAVVVGLSMSGGVEGADYSYHKKDAAKLRELIAGL